MKLVNRNVINSSTMAHYPYPKDISLSDADPDDASASIYLKKSLKYSSLLQTVTSKDSKHKDPQDSSERRRRVL